MAEGAKKKSGGTAIFAVLAIAALGGGFFAGQAMKPAGEDVATTEIQAGVESGEVAVKEVDAGIFAFQRRGEDEPVAVSVTLTVDAEKAPGPEEMRAEIYAMILSISEMPAVMTNMSEEGVETAIMAIAESGAPWVRGVKVAAPSI